MYQSAGGPSGQAAALWQWRRAPSWQWRLIFFRAGRTTAAFGDGLGRRLPLSELQTPTGYAAGLARPAPSLPAAQVGAQSELAAGGGEAPASGAPSAQGLVEKATGSGNAAGAPGGQQPLKKAEPLGGGDTGPDAGMLPPTEPAAPPKRGLWRALSSLTNRKGGGTQARPLPLTLALPCAAGVLACWCAAGGL